MALFDFMTIKNELIVSCQALENEPLHGSNIMAAMAIAAMQGGAAAIRANSPSDIRAIKSICPLPLIGLYKKNYKDSEVYITPTMKEASAVIEAGADIVAIDATSNERPDNVKLEQLIREIRIQYPDTAILADISTEEEGKRAMDLGVDAVSTTLSGYTSYSPKLIGPDIELVRRLSSLGRKPVLAEGRISSPEEAAACAHAGAFAIVVGSAITRPQEITHRFHQKLIHEYENLSS